MVAEEFALANVVVPVLEPLTMMSLDGKVFAAPHVCAVLNPGIVCEVPGNVIVVASVPASVSELFTVSVLVAVTERPVTLVAAIVPVPDTARLPPVPMTSAAAFVPAVIALKAGEPPLPQSDPVPVTTPVELACRHCVEPVMPAMVSACSTTLPW